MKKRLLSFLLALFMVLALFPATALAADTTIDILAIGDSITAGYGLASPETECFTALLAPHYNSVTNKAVSGNTAPGILSQFTDSPLQNAPRITNADVLQADVVTITCGGNDLMQVLYVALSNAWNEKYPKDPVSPDQITTILKNSEDSRFLKMMLLAYGLMDEDSDDYFINDPSITQELDALVDGFVAISQTIHSINPDAAVIVETQYNPYVECKDLSVTFLLFRFDLNRIYKSMEDGTKLLNDTIRANASMGNYLVAEVKAAFDAYSGSEDLYNAHIDPDDFSSLSVDFHPTAAGHRLIADTFRSVIDGLTYGITVSSSGSGTVTASVQTAKPGDTVTLTAAPADDFHLDTITAADGNNDPVTLTAAGADTYCFTMPVGNVFVSASFRRADPIITFDPLCSDLAPESKTIPYNSILTDIPAFTRENRIFRGWYTSSDGGQTLDAPADLTKPITGNLTLYAKWVACTEVNGLKFAADGYLLLDSLPENTAQIIAATYHDDNQMLTAQAVSIPAGLAEFQLPQTAGDVRIFVLDEDHCPLLPVVSAP